MNLRANIFFVLIFSVTVSACHGHQSPATSSAPQTAQPAQTTPTVVPISIAGPQASPGAQQAADKSKSNDGVPDIMKRPMTPEETKKAMEALPPEVRARLQGLGQKPAKPTPTATPKK